MVPISSFCFLASYLFVSCSVLLLLSEAQCGPGNRNFVLHGIYDEK